MTDAITMLLEDERRLHAIIHTLNRLNIKRPDIKNKIDEQLRNTKSLRKKFVSEEEEFIKLPDWFGSRT